MKKLNITIILLFLFALTVQAQLEVQSSGRLLVTKESEALTFKGGSAWIEWESDAAALEGWLWHNTATAEMELMNYVSGPLRLGTNGFDRLEIGATGEVDILKTGIALRVNGDEALWYNGSYFSWGFGGTYNYFADKIGIGTTVPDAQLHVNNGDIKIEDSYPFILLEPALNTNNQGISFRNASNSERAFIGYHGSGNNVMINNSGYPAPDLIVTPTGDVGIGTATPGRKLEVLGQLMVTNLNTYPTAKQSTMVMRHYSNPALDFAYFKAQTSATQNLVNFGGGAGANAAATAVVFFSTPGISDLNGTERMRIRGDGRVRISSTGGSTTHDLTLHGTAAKTGGGSWAGISDRRLKQNVRKFDGGLKEVMEIKPVYYQYKEGIDPLRKEYVGVIAQEMQKVAPYTVEEKEVTFEEGEKRTIEYDNILTYDGTAVTYMLVNAVQEQQAQIEERDEAIEDLQAENAQIQDQLAKLTEIVLSLQKNCACADVQEKVSKDKVELSGDLPYLEQNQPNPFRENTLIKYYLPEGHENASINIFTSEGKLLKNVKITEYGHGQINLTANSLPAGSYMYQLVTDKGVVANKTMVLQ